MKNAPNYYLITYEANGDHARFIEKLVIKQLSELLYHPKGDHALRSPSFEVFELYVEVEVGQKLKRDDVEKVLSSCRSEMEITACEDNLKKAKERLAAAKERGLE